MFQRNVISGIFRTAIVCLCVLFAYAFAYAEALPEITASCRPESLIAPAEITITFTIDNQTGNDCPNFYISTADGLISEPIGSLSSGETASFTRRHSVTEQELDEGKIAYIFSYDDPESQDRKINFTAEAMIARAESRANCEFTRRLSSDTVAPGGSVTIVYNVRNTGNVPIEELHVTDTIGEFFGKVEYLSVGESRSLINRAAISEAITSNAVLTYETEDGSQTIALEPVEIGVSSPALSAYLRVESDPSDPYARIGYLTLNNAGDVNYSRVTITDDFTGTVIAEGLLLPAGTARTIEYGFAYRNDRDIRWRVMADASDGSALDLMTNTVHPVSDRESDFPEITMTAQALTPKLKHGGSAKIRLTIENNGSAFARDLRIHEVNLGDITDLAFIAAGGKIVRDVSVEIKADTELLFNLDYIDEDSWPNSIYCEPVSVRIAADGVQPENSASGADAVGGSIHIGGSAAFMILMIIGVVLLIVLTIIWIILAHRARIRKQVRIALQKQNKGMK